MEKVDVAIKGKERMQWLFIDNVDIEDAHKLNEILSKYNLEARVKHQKEAITND